MYWTMLLERFVRGWPVATDLYSRDFHIPVEAGEHIQNVKVNVKLFSGVEVGLVAGCSVQPYGPPDQLISVSEGSAAEGKNGYCTVFELIQSQLL